MRVAAVIVAATAFVFSLALIGKELDAVEPLEVPNQAPVCELVTVYDTQLIKDCLFSEPCRFRSVHEFNRDVRDLQTRVAFVERKR